MTTPTMTRQRKTPWTPRVGQKFRAYQTLGDLRRSYHIGGVLTCTRVQDCGAVETQDCTFRPKYGWLFQEVKT